MSNKLITKLLNDSTVADSIYHRCRKIDELYSLAVKRCAFLMQNRKYRKIILANNDPKIILAKGYFQGFYEALQMINAQIK